MTLEKQVKMLEKQVEELAEANTKLQTQNAKQAEREHIISTAPNTNNYGTISLRKEMQNSSDKGCCAACTIC
jgi:TolA-binding protein